VVGPICSILHVFLDLSDLKFGQKDMNFWSLRQEDVWLPPRLKFVWLMCWYYFSEC